MSNVLVTNRMNHMGDAMCQMRGLKEWKDQHPDAKLTYVTTEYLHLLMATHTDLFESITLTTFAEAGEIATDPQWDQVIEFQIDWGAACDHGILKAWTEKTLGFTPSTDVPYFIVRQEERIVAAAQAKRLRKRFNKLVLMQLEAPSGAVRSFRDEDWEKVLDLIPEEVGIIYPGPIDLAYQKRLKDRPNLILLPGYDIGTTAALINEVDAVFGTHGGTIMLAHAVEAKNVVQVMFGEGGTVNILKVPEWDNLFYPSNRQIDWEELRKAITARL